MGSFHLIPFQPTLPAIAEKFDALGWQYQAVFADNRQSYRGLHLYSGQSGLEKDILYIVTEEYREVFPVNAYSYLSSETISGKAGHICVFQRSPKQLLEQLLALFQQYHDLEKELSELVFSEASLDDLCNWYRKITGNPVCIHDGWFIIIAMSNDLPDIMSPESVGTSVKQYIPKSLSKRSNLTRTIWAPMPIRKPWCGSPPTNRNPTDVFMPTSGTRMSA